ncbi:MAG: hypothetical protein LBT89_08890 [Planctomycetaceae bacterium]|jgi:hypothetical protein|nr:hypothetical protein [Planctomycetaceae bacterium]
MTALPTDTYSTPSYNKTPVTSSASAANTAGTNTETADSQNKYEDTYESCIDLPRLNAGCHISGKQGVWIFDNAGNVLSQPANATEEDTRKMTENAVEMMKTAKESAAYAKLALELGIDISRESYEEESEYHKKNGFSNQ